MGMKKSFDSLMISDY